MWGGAGGLAAEKPRWNHDPRVYAGDSGKSRQAALGRMGQRKWRSGPGALNSPGISMERPGSEQEKQGRAQRDRLLLRH